MSSTTGKHALRPEELGFGRLFACLPEMAIVVDARSGRVVLWNPGAERLLGYSRDAAIGERLEALIPGLLEPLQRAGVGGQRAAETGAPLGDQTPLVVPAVTSSGQNLVLEVSFSTIEDAPTPGRFVLALGREVTERVRAHQALEQQAASLRAQARLLDLAHDAIVVWELQTGAIRFWNPAAEQLYGWTSAEVVGRTPEAVLHTRFPRPLAEINAELMHTGRWEGELVHTRRDGAAVVVASRWALQDEAGQPRTVLGINRDVTGRKQAELALRREQEFSRHLIDSSTDGILAFDLACRYTTWNPAMERISGMRKELVLGCSAFEVFPFLRETGEDRFFLDALAGKTLIATDRPYTVPETGHAGFFEGQYAPIRDETGAVVGGLAIIRDITERKRAEEERAQLLREQSARAQAEVALRERDDVLATVSHDLKAPLATIGGQADLLRRRLERTGTVERERLAKGLELIGTAARKMGTWIDELLDAARLEAGRPVELHSEPTDLVALAWQAAAEQQRTTERHRIRVQTAETKLIGVWDPVRLGRVLDNLVSNAIKFSPAGGDVVVTVAREADAAGEWAVLSVRDEGIGIPAADLPHVFERFQRGTNVIGAIAGTGIGLASACQIVQLHGGSINVESQEGRGSTFTLRLPFPTARSTAARSRHSRPGS